MVSALSVLEQWLERAGVAVIAVVGVGAVSVGATAGTYRGVCVIVEQSLVIELPVLSATV